MAIKFIEMGLNIKGPYFKNTALRLVQGSISKEIICTNLFSFLLEQGADPNSQANDESK